jgi:hypothetical protein
MIQDIRIFPKRYIPKKKIMENDISHHYHASLIDGLSAFGTKIVHFPVGEETCKAHPVAKKVNNVLLPHMFPADYTKVPVRILSLLFLNVGNLHRVGQIDKPFHYCGCQSCCLPPSSSHPTQHCIDPSLRSPASLHCVYCHFLSIHVFRNFPLPFSTGNCCLALGLTPGWGRRGNPMCQSRCPLGESKFKRKVKFQKYFIAQKILL